MPLKYCGSLRFSDSEIPPAKAQRRQVRRGRKNILANGFHHFSPTFAAFAFFAGDIPSFRRGCSPTRRTFFPSAVWENACTTMLESFRGLRKFSVVRNPPRRGFTRAKSPSSETFSFYLCAFASLRLCSGHALREIFRFFWLRLRRARAIVSSFHSLCLVANMDQGSGARRERQRRLNSAERRRDVIETFLRRLHEQENRFVCLARIR